MKVPSFVPIGGMASALAVATLVVALLAVAGCGDAVEPAAPELQRFSYDEPHMGTTFRIVLYAADADLARTAADAAFARIAELEDILSDYDENSELSRLAATSGSGEIVPLSDDLYYVLHRSQETALATRGAFDLTVGPVVEHWRRARRRRQLPTQQQIDRAMESVGHEHIVLDADVRTARLTAPDMKLDPGGIGKGYAVSQALDVLRAQGLSRAMVVGGGDIAMGDAPPDRDGWRVAIVQPIHREHLSTQRNDGDTLSEDDLPEDAFDDAPAQAEYLIADNLAVSTSGDAFQAVELDGVRYSHIVDPRTGWATTTPMGVTVIMPDATTADALATAVSVLGPDEGLPMVESFGAAAIVTYLDEDGRIRREQTDTLSTYRIVTEAELDDE